jgi:predicted metal-dependent phosphoesterase TrpH
MPNVKEWVKVEFHCHTVYSGDSSNRISRLLPLARQRGLDHLAITDHNTIQGALRAKELDNELVIIAEEIRTTQGEILAYFVSEQVPGGLVPLEALERLKKQNAFISVPHPFDPMRRGWSREELEKILPYLDALEVFNARCFDRTANDHAEEYAREKQLSMLVGSDAHSLLELAMACVELPEFHSADELRQVIRQAKMISQYMAVTDHLLSNALIFINKVLPWNWVKKQ